MQRSLYDIRKRNHPRTLLGLPPVISWAATDLWTLGSSPDYMEIWNPNQEAEEMCQSRDGQSGYRRRRGRGRGHEHRSGYGHD